MVTVFTARRRGDKIHIRFADDPVASGTLGHVRGGKYRPDHRTWTFPATSAHDASRQLARWDVDGALRAIADAVDVEHPELIAERQAEALRRRLTDDLEALVGALNVLTERVDRHDALDYLRKHNLTSEWDIRGVDLDAIGDAIEIARDEMKERTR